MIGDPEVVNAYAGALLEAVRKQGTLQQASDEAHTLIDVFQANPRLRIFLESPNIPDREKVALLDRVLKPRFMATLVNYMELMLRRRRLDNLVPSLDRFCELVLEAQGRHPATFTTAVPVSFADKQLLEQAMEGVTGFKLTSTFRVRPELLGGVLFQCGDILIDSTLRSRLQAIERRLSHAVVV